MLLLWRIHPRDLDYHAAPSCGRRPGDGADVCVRAKTGLQLGSRYLVTMAPSPYRVPPALAAAAASSAFSRARIASRTAYSAASIAAYAKSIAK